MAITVTRDRSKKLRSVVSIGAHAFAVDEPEGNGGDDTGPTPHDIYDGALGACKAMTLLWYANRKSIPVEDLAVSVVRDDSEERAGVYRLRVTLDITGPLTEAQRQDLLRVAEKCPIHRLMTQVTTEISTELAPVAS